MVHHVRGLPLMSNTQEPSTYVKVYLLPDDSKSTKRKTKVIKRNCHPSFMEMVRKSILPFTATSNNNYNLTYSWSTDYPLK